MNISHKKVFIIGGSEGIGFSLAKEFLESANEVTISGRTLAKLTRAKDELLQAYPGSNVSIFCGDINLDTARKEMRELNEKQNFDIIIFSVGIAVPRCFADLSVGDLNTMLHTNLVSIIQCTYEFMPHLLKRNSGSLVYLGSVSSLIGIYGYTGYSASKFGLFGFAQALNQELAKTGININFAFPPDTKTPGFELENKIKPSLTKKISGGVCYDSAFVAKEILKGIRKEKFRIYPGIMNSLQCFFIEKFAPFVHFFILRQIRNS